MEKYVYRLTIKDSKIVGVLSEDKEKHFVAPVIKKSPKIYLVGKDKAIHYVGITTQSIAARLRYGMNPKHSKGYHGYKWRKDNGNHCLVVWVMDKNTNVEAIEAEIVFLIRKNKNQWPKHQTEIHFHSSTKKDRALAKKILNETNKII